MNKWMYILLVVGMLFAISACNTIDPPSQEPSDVQQLRISNIGSEDIQDLTVVFPGNTPAEVVRINFGNVAAGETTEYQEVPGGVYRYAAYEYTLNDEIVHQPVTDWVGEKPLVGAQFAYQIVLDTTRVKGNQIELIEVLNESE